MSGISHPDLDGTLVAPPGLAYGLARMFAAYSQGAGQEIEVFGHIQRARTWLGIDTDLSDVPP